jgi:hypothetical protein
MLRQLGTQPYTSMLYNYDLMEVDSGRQLYRCMYVCMYIAFGRLFGAYDCVAVFMHFI